MVFTPSELSHCLTEQVGIHVEVKFSRAMSQPVKGQRNGRHWDLRLNGAFAEAPQEVIDSLARWLRNGRRSKRACQKLDQWLEENIYSQRTRRSTPRRSGRGVAYDLDEMAQDLWDGFLGSRLASEERPHLEWGQRRPSRSRGGLRLGSWDPHTNRVRLHPVLDDSRIPDWFVRTVLVHELLHAAHPPQRDRAGRWCPHHGEFRQREQSWPDHARAREYEREHMAQLVRTARGLGKN